MPPARRLSLPEFTALMATLVATIAFSIDAMLPALPEIAHELTPDAINRAQLVLTTFVLGMGLGTFLAGPISDALGRKITIVGGFAIYLVGALMAMTSGSIEMLLLARFLQGLGASGPRIAAIALIRDLYAGREMARITSVVMMLFILIPAVAPSIGQVIINLSGWRGVFGAFVVFSLLAVAWLTIRQEETLPTERRRPLRWASIRESAREVLSDAHVRIYIAVLTLGFGQMFALLSSAQQIFGEVYGRVESFPLWFALMALLSGAGSLLNARVVMRIGMRKMAANAYIGQTFISAAMLGLAALGVLSGPAGFALFFFWAVSVFFIAGVTFGNLNALALENMGHIAGMATSIVAAISTVLSVAIAAPIGLAFNGTPVPAITGAFICSALAWVLMKKVSASK